MNEEKKEEEEEQAQEENKKREERRERKSRPHGPTPLFSYRHKYSNSASLIKVLTLFSSMMSLDRIQCSSEHISRPKTMLLSTGLPEKVNDFI
jgi:hypothetical protein